MKKVTTSPKDLGPLIRVRATQLGFDGLKRRYEGDEFAVHEKLFSENWMEKVGGKVEELPKEPDTASFPPKGKPDAKTLSAAQQDHAPKGGKGKKSTGDTNVI